MDLRTVRRMVALGVVGTSLGLAPAAAVAQYGATVGRSTPPAAALTGTGTGAGSSPGVLTPFGTGTGLYANPYTNPYMNPFLNPYATQTPTSAGNAALYFMAAQQRNGGLGSGQLGGPKAPAPGRGRRSPATPTEESPRGASNTPGGSASRYFNRTTPTSAGLGRYYNRRNPNDPGKGY